MPALIDRTGQRFGRLVVVSRALDNNNEGKPRWTCTCDCGATAIIDGAKLASGNTQSCGCLKVERDRKYLRPFQPTHGDTTGGRVTAEYHAWRGVLDRTTNPQNKDWHKYGGRGITVCERWRTDFANFLADMGRKPSPAHSLDRINNDGPYAPDNCRWATVKEQGRNRRTNVFVLVKGQRTCLIDACHTLALCYVTASKKLRHGLPVHPDLTPL